MKKITVRDLKVFLAKIPDDYTVILSKDGEGNLFSPMSKSISLGRYKPEIDYGDFEFDNKAPTSVVFFPIN